MSLKEVAKETLDILKSGQFVTKSGKVIEFAAEQKQAEDGTRLYSPEINESLLENSPALNQENHCLVEVTEEKTQVAAYRLVNQEGCHDLVLLNFASARNPGGGFVNGAKAQEEDLARCSGLYPCQLKQPQYYEKNRSNQSLLYTEHLIYSPRVPWFRTHSRKLLDRYFLASVITAPAPNAGQVLCRNPDAGPEIERVLRRRAGYILAVAQENGHRSLLLGAWGCGVFCNNSSMVADAFGQWLESPRFRGCFERVVFGIYDSSKSQDTLKAFRSRFE
ncbi:MAG: TIGR02452 family protein [Spirulina sp. SIO3F2]|nr:TIGR02452 family protein [Spirulina sp. SIO3F2]